MESEHAVSRAPDRWEDEKVSRGEEKWLNGGFRQAYGESPEDSFGGMMVINGKCHLRNTHSDFLPIILLFSQRDAYGTKFQRFRITTVKRYIIF